jgi:ubiquinone/menaquinone biosynthesis C-methylase UbiE
VRCWWAPVYDRANGPFERAVLAPRRAALLSDLRGVVLDVGAGTGANLEHFHNASRVIALEPDPGMRKRLAPKLPTARCEVEVLGAPAEALPLRDQTVDAVVFTCVLCSVEDVDQALAEARRTLKPHGRLVVLEHVRGHGRLARWQDVVTPVWSCLAGGCHPNRDIEPAVLRAGFAIERAERFDPFPRLVPTRPVLEATASPAEAIERSRRSAPAR